MAENGISFNLERKRDGGRILQQIRQFARVASDRTIKILELQIFLLYTLSRSCRLKATGKEISNVKVEREQSRVKCRTGTKMQNRARRLSRVASSAAVGKSN